MTTQFFSESNSQLSSPLEDNKYILPQIVKQYIFRQLGLLKNDSNFSHLINTNQQTENQDNITQYILYTQAIFSRIKSLGKIKSLPNRRQKLAIHRYDHYKSIIGKLKVNRSYHTLTSTSITFFQSLITLSKVTSLQINIPTTLILGFGLPNPLKLYTSQQGFVKSTDFYIENIYKYLREIANQPLTETCPQFVVKVQTDLGGGQTRYHFQIWTHFQLKLLTKRLQYFMDNYKSVIIQKYIVDDRLIPSKIRTHEKRGNFEAYMLMSIRQLAFQQYNPLKQLPYTILNVTPHLLFTNQEFINSSILNYISNRNRQIFLGQLYNIQKNPESARDFYQKSIQILQFIEEIFLSMKELNKGRIARQHNLSVQFFVKKMIQEFEEELEEISARRYQDDTGQIPYRSVWSSQFVAKVSNKQYLLAYQITDHQFLLTLKKHMKSIKQSTEKLVLQDKVITELLVDFVQNPNGDLVFIALHTLDYSHINTFMSKKHNIIRHVSIYNATSASFKNKIRREVICCGDYCKIIRAVDTQTRDKIEWLMKFNPSLSQLLYSLLELQKQLGEDALNNLKCKGTNLTKSGNQYNVIRKVIIDDRKDKNSLRAQLLHLPIAMAVQLKINLQPKIPKGEYSYNMNPIFSIHRFQWEFESVPVCDICYKVYYSRENMMKNRQDIVDQFWMDSPQQELGVKLENIKSLKKIRFRNAVTRDPSPKFGKKKRSQSYGTNLLRQMEKIKLPNLKTPKIVDAIKKRIRRRKFKLSKEETSKELSEFQPRRRANTLEFSVEMYDNIRSKLLKNKEKHVIS